MDPETKRFTISRDVVSDEVSTLYPTQNCFIDSDVFDDNEISQSITEAPEVINHDSHDSPNEDEFYPEETDQATRKHGPEHHQAT